MAGKKTDAGCPESASTMHSGESSTKDGTCNWCGAKVYPAAPAPRRFGDPTELDTEYRRTYDPDFGSGKRDV
jgi:rRNA maturation protein Nop10